METIQIITLVAVLIALGLSIYALHKCNKNSSSAEKYAKKVKWNPPVVDPSKTMQWSDDPAQNSAIASQCTQAFAQIDKGCQAIPMKADNPDYNEQCADYPMYFCGGQMMSTGNLDDNCGQGMPVALSASQCQQPIQSQGSYLCAMPNDPQVLPACNTCNGSGSVPANSNPWGVTGSCN